MDNFTTTTHSKPTPNIDPSTVTLPKPFVVCIIGASSGIGEHIAYAYAHASASDIVISSRKSSDLDRVTDAIHAINSSIQVSAFPCDITSASSVSALAEHVESTFGRLDVLIANSGYAGPVTLRVTEGEPEWFAQNFAVNTVGTYHAAHYFIPLLLRSENGAKLFIVVGSLAACIMNGPIANTGYCLSKMAQSRFVEYLGEQYGKEGLLAVDVHPGAVMTPMAEGNTPEEFLPYLVDSVDLCGAVCVWLTKQTKNMQWLTGRFISANWDMDELVKVKREEIIQKDLLKWHMATS